jgi:hypothetical protein
MEKREYLGKDRRVWIVKAGAVVYPIDQEHYLSRHWKETDKGITQYVQPVEYAIKW